MGNSSTILIHNVMLLTMNPLREVIDKGAVIIEDDTIVYAGREKDSLFDVPQLKSPAFTQVIDGQRGILMPGMINAHTHAAMIAFRSLADDVPDRLQRYIFPLEKKLVQSRLVSVASRYAIAEMLLGGVTTFCDMYYFEHEVAQEAQDLGARAVLGETVVNFPSPDSPLPYGGLEYCADFISRWKGKGLVIPAVAPHAIYSLDGNHLQRCYELAKTFEVPVTMHLAEMPYETAQVQEEYGMTPVQYLDSLGILNESWIAAHVIHVDHRDLDLLQERGVGISHNIGANAKGAKGVAPAVEMYRRGMKIGLGTDGPMSGNTLDILTQLSLVGKIHKLYNQDRSLFPAIELVEMGTLGGARALGLDRLIGSIEIGKKADLVLLETASLNMQPLYDPYSVIVYSANPGNVDTVVVNGRIVVQHKKLLSGDCTLIRDHFLELQALIKTGVSALEM